MVAGRVGPGHLGERRDGPDQGVGVEMDQHGDGQQHDGHSDESEAEFAPGAGVDLVRGHGGDDEPVGDAAPGRVESAARAVLAHELADTRAGGEDATHLVADRPDLADPTLRKIRGKHHGVAGVDDADDERRAVRGEEQLSGKPREIDGRGEDQVRLLAEGMRGDAAPLAGGHALGGAAHDEIARVQHLRDVGHAAVVLRRVGDGECRGKAQRAAAIQHGDVDEFRMQAEELLRSLVGACGGEVAEADDAFEFLEHEVHVLKVVVQRLLGRDALGMQPLQCGGAVVDEFLPDADADESDQGDGQCQRKQDQSKLQRVAHAKRAQGEKR